MHLAKKAQDSESPLLMGAKETTPTGSAATIKDAENETNRKAIGNASGSEIIAVAALRRLTFLCFLMNHFYKRQKTMKKKNRKYDLLGI